MWEWIASKMIAAQDMGMDGGKQCLAPMLNKLETRFFTTRQVMSTGVGPGQAFRFALERFIDSVWQGSQCAPDDC